MPDSIIIIWVGYNGLEVATIRRKGRRD